MAKDFDAVAVQESAYYCRRMMRGRRYIHYKGGEYVVRFVTVDEATGVTLVHYQSLDLGYYWTRTRANFEEIVETGLRRFEPQPRWLEKCPPIVVHLFIYSPIIVGVLLVLGLFWLLGLLIQHY